ncbi:hypothetical protein PCASD_17262 [Puccinia coronata f. sp. avenae]|uniref:Uncharacterized protein n=2 Tax=Puccinia coronata f. sp. avenae TaxID=200324 RepID=A0A2N5U849_9BASI|nr:hypothetical protein PCASD_13884 [Puccinia coronata f. sp. avenae]PLW34297.1 hypothetical protein PCASD_17262 [Puccinia coronata f. sp. avenae]
MAASEFLLDAAIRFKLGNSLGGARPSLNRMAASDKNSDAAIRANFSGSVAYQPEHPTGVAPATFNGHLWDLNESSHKYPNGLSPASPGQPPTSMSLQDLHPNELSSNDMFAGLLPNHQAGVTSPKELLWEEDGYQLHGNQPSEPQRLELRDDLAYCGNLATSVQAGPSHYPASREKAYLLTELVLPQQAYLACSDVDVNRPYQVEKLTLPHASM